MAFVGNAPGLATQPASSTSGGHVGSWKLPVIVVVTGAVLATAFILGSNHVAPAGLIRPQIDDLQLPVAQAGLIRPQIDDVQLPIAPAGLSRAQIASLGQTVAPAGLSRAQIASLGQTVAPAGLSRPQIDDSQLPVAAASVTRAQIDVQQGISRLVYQTAPSDELRRTGK